MTVDTEVLATAHAMLSEFGLRGWRVTVTDYIDECEGAAGFTHNADRHIELSRQYWPTHPENIRELMRHEIAHALIGHGEHDSEWRALLESIGGTLKWIRANGDLSDGPAL